MFWAEGKEREEDHDVQTAVVVGTIVGSSVTGKGEDLRGRQECNDVGP